MTQLLTKKEKQQLLREKLDKLLEMNYETFYPVRQEDYESVANRVLAWNTFETLAELIGIVNILFIEEYET